MMNICQINFWLGFCPGTRVHQTISLDFKEGKSYTEGTVNSRVGRGGAGLLGRRSHW